MVIARTGEGGPATGRGLRGQVLPVPARSHLVFLCLRLVSPPLAKL